ncbi:MAG: arsenate reductase ArsC [Mycobacterium sp.]|uniref:arsenate reductase ArsC n=1 Tax=Mycobacterium sp. TaxID=1785 RepID=UPI002613FA3D|nr:arsenate reductase ArsC [Mycobacterium sp.]MDI3313691.1 arsenate reductase ArsC [Mycobacterium sp.]
MTFKPDTEPGLHIELSLDQRRALKAAAARLHAEFDGTFDVQTIERFVYSSYNKVAAGATVYDFLALLAERFTRQRLRALAKVEGKSGDDKPVVLFLCNHNAGRSQMAMAFFNHLTGGEAVAWSGGSQPQREVNPAVVAVMAERGIDISGEYPKPWTDEIVEAADLIASMGCADAPTGPGFQHQDWVIDDPDGKDMAALRDIRDDIEQKVRRLIADLGLPCRD